ncbi:MAG: formamidopyrimidine-DNA glycosylase [Lysobacterales bacterium]|nr:MAG: formamidopyrimidine-DNA glycosylase [Xanthomonadales bacterium]
MPELPDVVVYVERLRALLGGATLTRVRIGNPFVLRTVEPALAEVEGKKIHTLERIGKRIVLCLEDELFLVVHLMIAGRFRWRAPDAGIPKANGLAAFDFDAGTLILIEAGRKRRASLHVVRGRDALQEFNRGGLEGLRASLVSFCDALLRENHTLKRALTDQSVLSGIGNAYSDEILLRAKLSPFKQTRSLSDEELAALFNATCAILEEWTAHLRSEVGDGFPEKVTAFREGMAVHGRFRKPCPVCGAPVQRIVYAHNECNYCARCQTGGKLLADRALSRLLKKNWPRRIEDIE